MTSDEKTLPELLAHLAFDHFGFGPERVDRSWDILKSWEEFWISTPRAQREKASMVNFWVKRPDHL